MPLDIDVSAIKVKKGKMPPVAIAAGRGPRSNPVYEQLYELVRTMEPDSWFAIPGTEHDPADKDARKKAYSLRGNIARFIRKNSIEGVAFAFAAADNSIIVRKTAELVDARSGRPIDAPPPPARPKAQRLS